MATVKLGTAVRAASERVARDGVRDDELAEAVADTVAEVVNFLNSSIKNKRVDFGMLAGSALSRVNAAPKNPLITGVVTGLMKSDLSEKIAQIIFGLDSNSESKE